MFTRERRMAERRTEAACPADVSDAALYARFLAARAPADFEALVARLHGFAYSVALCICANPALADEAVQESFLLLAQGRASDPPGDAGAFKGWFYKVVVNVARHGYRSERRTTMRSRSSEYLERAEAEQRARSADEAAGGSPHEEELAALRQAMNGLSEELRLPLVLHYLQGLSQTEIGQLAGVSTSHVSRRIAQGLELLRVRMLQAGVTMSAVSLPGLLGQLYLTPPALAGELARACLFKAGLGLAANESARAATAKAGLAAWLWPAASVAVLAGAMVWSVLGRGGGEAPKVSAGSSAPQAEAAPLAKRSWSFDAGPQPEIERVHEGWEWRRTNGKGELVFTQNNWGGLLLPIETPARPFKVTLRIFPPKFTPGVSMQCNLGALWTDGQMIPPRIAWRRDSLTLDGTKTFTTELYFAGRFVTSFANGNAFHALEFKEPYPCKRVCLTISPEVALQEASFEEVREQDLPAAARDPGIALYMTNGKKYHYATWILRGKPEENKEPAEEAPR